MATALTPLSALAPTDAGLEYAALKKRGTELVQELSGNLWTDYNESDPGVTTLEQLCYALTDLSYRARLPVADLLVRSPDGAIDGRRQALYSAKRIFPNEPLTIDDYRKLLVDRLPEVANAWPRPAREQGRVGGLWDLFLWAPDVGDDACDFEHLAHRLEAEARRLYAHHRTLCEDLRAVHVLRPVRTAVGADVSIAATPAAETILAGILFALGNHLAPELLRRPLAAEVDAGRPPSEIFDGPLLLHGFYDDAQLLPKATSFTAFELGQVIAAAPGVRGVRNVRLRAGHRPPPATPTTPVPVDPREMLVLDTRSEGRDGRFAIRLFLNGVEVRPDPRRVQRELARLWAVQRRRYPLAREYGEYFGLPKGVWRELSAYSSIQNQYPEIYGIGSYGLPNSAPPERRAQARQLKGYLLAFEQQMANFFAQLAAAKDLFSTDPRLDQTYFYQYLDDLVPDVAPLLSEPGQQGPGTPGYHQGLAELMAAGDPVLERRNRFLDALLARFAEGLTAGQVWGGQAGGTAALEVLVPAKLALLTRLVAATAERARGFDTLAPPSPANRAGLEIKCRIQLGLAQLEPRPLVDLLDELGVRLVEGEAEASLGRPLGRYDDAVTAEFTTVVPAAENGADTLRGAALPERLLAPGDGGAGEFRLGSLPGERGTSVVWRAAAEEPWRLLGTHGTPAAARSACGGLVAPLEALRRHARQLYVVEHNLLRYGRFRERDPGRDGGFVYDYTVTAVLGDPGCDENYRAFAREVLRANVPAHLVVDFCFLAPCALCRFELLYWA
ncbi:MAG: hypothetical protein SF066_14350, partial [Thermoanaerobaculia bacterium]|nr:hypothetical protein [Thermoanaerobaculia bacterium]